MRRWLAAPWALLLLGASLQGRRRASSVASAANVGQKERDQSSSNKLFEEQATGDVLILGAGFGRTGTSSFARALVDSGFTEGLKIYNMREVLRESRKHTPKWLEIGEAHAAGKPLGPLFRKLFRGYTVVTDYPACVWWKEILEEFPQAKLVLTSRDAESWYASSSNTTFPFVKFAKTNSLKELVELEKRVLELPGGRSSWRDIDGSKASKPHIAAYGEMMQRLVWDRIFGLGVDPSEPDQHDAVIAGYNAHVERVRGENKENRRFWDWTVGPNGWKPLCEILELEPARCPKGNLPHSNDVKTFFKSSLQPILNARLKPPPKPAAFSAKPAYGGRRTDL